MDKNAKGYSIEDFAKFFNKKVEFSNGKEIMSSPEYLKEVKNNKKWLKEKLKELKINLTPSKVYDLLDELAETRVIYQGKISWVIKLKEIRYNGKR